ncbi:hypothetical protein LPJ59_004434 [Coemansia sp. RSA 2399]|nr:hypothetical protein LPJ59_004434 [Coemansia sp. RSA 2399]KAJ1899250.1 hypothetical protein LPJ81_004179 [Coemansia sp. IMI 209127]
MSGYVRVIALFICAVCVGLLQHGGALALNVTCPSFDSLCETIYDNVTPQALRSILVTFESNTESQILASFCDALECRGSKVNVVNYSTRTLAGYVSSEYSSELQNSTHIASVVDVPFAGALARMPVLEDYAELSYDSEQGALESDASMDELSSSISASVGKPPVLIHATFACAAVLAFTLTF